MRRWRRICFGGFRKRRWSTEWFPERSRWLSKTPWSPELAKAFGPSRKPLAHERPRAGLFVSRADAEQQRIHVPGRHYLQANWETFAR